MPNHIVNRPDGREELVASQAFDLVAHPDTSTLLRAVVANSRNTAARPERWYEQIGEIHYGVNRGARIAGYAKITARKVNPDGTPGKVVTRGRAAEVAAMFSSPYGGQRALIERFFTLMKIPGDAYMIRTREHPDGSGEITGYDVIGASEIDMASLEGLDSRAIKPTQMIRRITLPNSREVQLDQVVMVPPEDFLGRIWRPAVKYVQMADSPMAALDTQCEILHYLTLALKGKLLSRLALNGILYWPSEVADIRAGQPGANENPVLDNKVLTKLIEAATWAVTNFEDPRSALPIFASGPAEFGAAIQHIVLDREIYQTDLNLRNEMIERILAGLDVNKSQTKGETDMTRFNAWSQTDDEMRVNITPDLEMFMWASTRLVLNREMMTSDVSSKTAEKYMFWYDMSSASTNSNQAEDARQADDRVLISGDAARTAMGFKAEDAIEGDELVRKVGLKVNNPYLALWGTPEFAKIDWDKAMPSVKAGPNEASPGDKPEANPGNQPKKSPATPETKKAASAITTLKSA